MDEFGKDWAKRGANGSMQIRVGLAVVSATIVLAIAVMGCEAKKDWSEYDRQFQTKIDECTKAIQSNPNDAGAFYTRGIAHVGGKTDIGPESTTTRRLLISRRLFDSTLSLQKRTIIAA